MSRYRGPHLKIIRRLKTLPGLTSKGPKNRKDTMNRSSSRKISQYRIRPKEKQKFHFHYGLT
jgi:small subunit ribosomal protein S4